MATYQTTLGKASGSGTVSTTAVTLDAVGGFTAAQLAAADRAFITAIGAGVRYRYDGVAPTAGLGHYLPPDASPPLEVLGNVNLQALQFIRAAGDDVTLFITLEW